jgi:hypothetical protein
LTHLPEPRRYQDGRGRDNHGAETQTGQYDLFHKTVPLIDRRQIPHGCEPVKSNEGYAELVAACRDAAVPLEIV